MFHHILVPLDGSRRAESALPVAASIARAKGGSLLLLKVVPSPIDSPPLALEPFAWPEGVSQAEYDSASAYLARQKKVEFLQDLPVQTQLVTGPVPQRILSCIETQDIDLVVMCSRGETGLKRWMWGSVAQKVLRHSRAPVLVLHESSGMLSNLHPAGPRPVRVLVALDGSALTEEALVPAATLAAALSAPEKGELHLVRVVPLPEPANSAEEESGARLLDLSEAQMYLQMAVDSLQGRENLTMTTSVVTDLDIAGVLIGTAEEGLPAIGEAEGRGPDDVIALATHGRSGIQRWVMGSIAERLLDGTRLPLLVVHPAWT